MVKRSGKLKKLKALTLDLRGLSEPEQQTPVGVSVKKNSMKITIDTEDKTIEVHNSENISDMVEQLKSMFPKDEWKKYKIKSAPVEYLPYYPYTFIYESRPNIYPHQQWFEPPFITCGTSS